MIKVFITIIAKKKLKQYLLFFVNVFYLTCQIIRKK